MSIKYFFCIVLTLPCAAGAWRLPWQPLPQVRIIICPAGDAYNPGRTIYDSVERSISFQWAESLKLALQDTLNNVTVSLSRMPGQACPPLHHAQLANQLNADLVISLACYQETQPKPHLYIYHFSTGQEFITALPQLHLYPLEQAYLISSSCTQRIASQLATTLHDNRYKNQCIVHGPYKFPYRPLLGMKVPAIALELGVKQGISWESIVQALVDGIKTWIEGAS